MTDGPIAERGDPRDRISNQRELFDVTRTTTAVCSVCGATRQPDQDRAPTCRVDRDRALGERPGRPKACLNTIDPALAPMPEGY